MSKFRNVDPVPDPDLLNPKSTVLNIVSRTIQLLCKVSSYFPIRGFRFLVLTHTHIHTHIDHDKFIAISAPPYYIVGADNKRNRT